MATFNLRKNWWIRGIVWGLLMFLVLVIILPLIREEGLNASVILIGFAFWIAMGLIFGAVTNAAKNEGRSKS